jgi:60 kDa SS-A/Ro ribonucleoprotein
MSNALKNVNTKVTPQRERSRSDEVKNNAGGFVFAVTDKSRLERFLILGTDGGTYYVGERKLTNQNIDFLRKMIQTDEALVLDTLVDVSVNGRAYKNSPALFALALVFVEGTNKAAARAALPKVARTSTHLFEFAQYIENLGGWGRAKRGAVADWYQSQEVDKLAYQLVKYRQRDGWTHRDLLRLSHPVGLDENVVNFALGKEHGIAPRIISGFEIVQQAENEQQVLNALSSFKDLPWEAIPTQFLKSEKVWKSLFYNGQLRGQALVRNITRLAKLGAFDDMKFAADYAERLTDSEMMIKTRLHPINYLVASVTYEDGQVPRGSQGMHSYYGRQKDWKSSAIITDALNEGFHLAFKAVEPARKRTFIGVDVSGSMSSGALGIDLSCAQVSGAMAMTIARTEPMYEIRGFTSSGSGYYSRGGAELTDLKITARTSLSTAMQNVRKSNFGGTDCALPMVYALKNKIEIDTFVVITDNETWAGEIKPAQALKQYRDKMGIDARLAVFGVASTNFTIADPKDRGMMDFVGFDSNAPKVLADFSAGRL